MLNAIQDSNGIISTIANRLNVSWDTARKRIKENEQYIQAYENERNCFLDKAESVIYNALENNDVSTAKWLLQIKGSDRGYTGTSIDTLDNDPFKFSFR